MYTLNIRLLLKLNFIYKFETLGEIHKNYLLGRLMRVYLEYYINDQLVDRPTSVHQPVEDILVEII
jgi:hypothetical protein